MATISQIVENIISQDYTAYDALAGKILNLSAYAKKIKPFVEENGFTAVKPGTIVAALARLQRSITPPAEIALPTSISNMHIESSLIDIAFEKNEDNIRKLFSLDRSHIKSYDFFTVSEGMSEITIICSPLLETKILRHFEETPKYIGRNLAAITLRFSEIFLEEPKVIFTYMKRLSSRRLNVLEVISTFSEVTLLIYQKDLDKAIQALQV